MNPFPLTAVTLNQLRDRLNAIIAENERRNRPEQNDRPVVVRVRRGGSRRDHYLPLLFADASMLGIVDNAGQKLHVTALIGDEEDLIRYGSKEHTEAAARK